jgi:hypothetical protein
VILVPPHALFPFSRGSTVLVGDALAIREPG